LFARVNGSSVVQTAGKPSNLIRLADGAKVLLSEYITEAELNACGWYTILEPARPVLTAQQTFDPDTFEFSDDLVSRVYHVRNKTADELAADQRAATLAINTATVTDLTTILGDIAGLKTFLADPDVQAVLDNANNTALPTATLNRALKAIVRQLRRDANFDIRLARYVIGQVHPDLLLDVSDTRPT
jgi:hypothetical protein